jgi:hypothetical protein
MVPFVIFFLSLPAQVASDYILQDVALKIANRDGLCAVMFTLAVYAAV